MHTYLVLAKDGTDPEALNRRLAAREAHLQGAAALKAAGNLIEGGAMLDEAGSMRGSVLLMRFPSAEDLQAWLQSDPYVTGKVWEEIEIKPIRLVDFQVLTQ
jgi:uncharacterized protein YciI